MKRISVIVTARNNAKYLRECLDSCINQTIKPYEVIYSDDFSEDNSLEVAKLIEGVIILDHNSHVGVVKARNDGAKLSEGNILVFVDGDDILPTDYLEKHLEVFDENCVFSYSSYQEFEDSNRYFNVNDDRQSFLWEGNFVQTSMMVWRDAFYKVGQWMETDVNRAWDWNLALRLSRLGKYRKTRAILNYRKHYDSSLTKYKRETPIEEGLVKLATARRELVTVSIGTVYSGRIKEFFKTWIECLISDIKILVSKPELIIVNNSTETLEVNTYREFFKSIKIINYPTSKQYPTTEDRKENVETVCSFLVDAYNLIVENSTGELIHLREDDIITPENGFKRLFERITSGVRLLPAIGAMYYNRQADAKYIGAIVSETNKLESVKIIKLPLEDTEIKVDYTGTACIIYWRDLCPLYYRKKSISSNIYSHDVAWGLELKRRERNITLLSDVVCKHYVDKDNYLQPLEKSNNWTSLVSPISIESTLHKKFKNNSLNALV